MIYPVIPQRAIPSSTVKGDASRGRGRPRRTYASKYAAYGGVYGYRKFIRARNSAIKYQNILRQQQMVKQQYQMARRGRIPIQTAYPQQVQVSPQELAMEMSNVPQEVAPQAIRRPVGRITPSYGGKPYPAIEGGQLQGSRDSEYYETTDAFTGRKMLKRRPQPEAWIRP